MSKAKSAKPPDSPAIVAIIDKLDDVTGKMMANYVAWVRGDRTSEDVLFTALEALFEFEPAFMEWTLSLDKKYGTADPMAWGHRMRRRFKSARHHIRMLAIETDGAPAPSKRRMLAVLQRLESVLTDCQSLRAGETGELPKWSAPITKKEIEKILGVGWRTLKRMVMRREIVFHPDSTRVRKKVLLDNLDAETAKKFPRH